MTDTRPPPPPPFGAELPPFPCTPTTSDVELVLSLALAADLAIGGDA